MSRRRGPVTHACPEDVACRTLCRRDIGPGDRVSCYEAAWDCPACLRLARLIVKVEEAADRLGWDAARPLLDAVAPGRAVYLLDEDQAARCLVVLRAVLGGGA